MRNWLNEILGIWEDPLGHQMRPKLLRLFKGLIDLERFGNIDRAICLLFSIIELAEGSMASASIVPRVGRFLGHFR